MKLTLASALLSLFAVQDAEKSVAERYHALVAADDRAGVVALWREHPGDTLPTIDRDLEGSLALIEKAENDGVEPDRDAIAAMHARARFGALAADEAFGTTIFADYAHAFIGWNAEERKRFRAGQAAFGAARRAMKAGEHEAALKHATECENLARPLGDWWGTAMGASARGAAFSALGRAGEAIAALGSAANLYHDLRLASSEYAQWRSLAALLAQEGSKPRAALAAERALALAESLGDREGAEALAKLQAELR